MAALPWSAGRAGLVLQCARVLVTAALLWGGSAGEGGILLLQLVCGTCSWCSAFSRLCKACCLFKNINIIVKCHLGLLTSLHFFFDEFLEGQFSEDDFRF